MAATDVASIPITARSAIAAATLSADIPELVASTEPAQAAAFMAQAQAEALMAV
jgi:hypothetical protein